MSRAQEGSASWARPELAVECVRSRLASFVVLKNVDVVRKKSVCELRRGTLGDAFRLYYSALSAGMRRSNGEKRAQ